ncbi:MAG: PIN domain-containing protein [Pseudomonadota bacterium]
MFANRYTALVDACSLVGALRRNFLLSLAEEEFFRLRWSPQILEEAERALARLFDERRLNDSSKLAAKQIATMSNAFPEAIVEDWDMLLSLGSGLPDPDDAHVLAAAVKVQAQTIVTENIKDFPKSVLNPLNLEPRTADDFIADTISLDEARAIQAIRRMRNRLKRPEKSPDALLRDCEAHGLIATADQLRPFVDLI